MALGKIVVSLSANITEFTSAMDKAAYTADKSMTGITRSIGLAGVAIGTLAFQAAQGFARSAAAAIQFGDDIQKAATKAGIAASTMSELAYAAAQSDVDINALSESFKKLQINSSKAASGSKEQVEAFKALGISAKDFKGLSLDQQFLVIAEQISKLEDPADRARAAVDIFGKSGANLLPMFEKGSKGVQDALSEAAKVGAKLSDEQVKRLADTDDALKRLKGSWQGFTANLIAGVEPVLSRILGIMTKIMSPPSEAGMIKTLELQLESLKYASDKSENSEYRRIERRLAALRKAAEERVKIEQETNAKVAAATAQGPKGFEDEEAKARREKAARDAEAALKRITEERASILQNLESSYMRMVVSAEDLLVLELARKGASEQELARAEAIVAAIRTRRAEEEALKQVEEDSKRATAEKQALLEQFPDLWFNAASAAEQYELELKKLDDLAKKLIAAGIDQARVNELVARSSKQIGDKYSESGKIAVEFGEAISSSFEEAILSGRNLQDVLKGLLQDILAIIIRAKVTTPLGNAITGALQSGGGDIISAILGGVASAFGFGGGASAGGAVATRGVTAPLPPTFSPPGRAFGGSVMAGNAYLVGEAGPEIFMPKSPGEVLDGRFTRGALGGNGGARIVNQTFNISTPNADSFRLSQRQLSRRARIGVNL